MCTVTFIPLKNKFFITSNRDEKILRKRALSPAVYSLEDTNILYPKDTGGGGTWIAMHENGNAIVLLNGCFKKHTPAPPYIKSRGIILLEVIKTAFPFKTFQRLNLSGVQPFTLVLLDNNFLYECRWDGKLKHQKELDSTKSYIWSSVTLYDDEIIQKREQWFKEWLAKNPQPTMRDILNFHLFTGDGDMHNDLRMNRNNEMLTLSVTGMEINNDKGTMQYYDLIKNELYKKELYFTSSYAIQ
jgi:uncharacterized protein with NRDE domain